MMERVSFVYKIFIYKYFSCDFRNITLGFSQNLFMKSSIIIIWFNRLIISIVNFLIDEVLINQSINLI